MNSIICKQWNILYIGQRGRPLGDRITEHICFMLKIFYGFLVVHQLNPSSDCSLKGLHGCVQLFTVIVQIKY